MTPKIKISQMVLVFFLVTIAAYLVACFGQPANPPSKETCDGSIFMPGCPVQDLYRQTYLFEICELISVDTELYKEKPSQYFWREQGVASTANERDAYFQRQVPMFVDLLKSSRGIPRTYNPNPSEYNIQEAEKVCPEIMSIFYEIPF